MLDKLKTITGVRADRIGDELAKPLEPIAYKGVPGGADLTDIGTAWMVEALHRVFGPCGLGWKLTYPKDDLTVLLDKRPTAYLRSAEFHYALVDEAGQVRWFTIQCNGGSTNNEIAYAMKGAVTSAMGAAISLLEWQLPVYKGLLNHHNAAAVLGKGADGAGGGGNGRRRRSPRTAAEKTGAADAGTSGEAGDPLASRPFPGDFVIPVGRYAGKKLSEVGQEVLAWYAKEMKPATDQGKALQDAAQALLRERTQASQGK